MQARPCSLSNGCDGCASTFKRGGYSGDSSSMLVEMDNLPRVIRRGDTFYVNGLFRHGFLLAPALAGMAAEAALDGTTPEFCHEDHS